ILETVGDDESLMRRDAEEFLRFVLADGEQAAKDVQAEARANGISERTLDRAKARLRIKSRKLHKKAPWLWSLRGPGDESLGCQLVENGTLEVTDDSKEDNPHECLKGAKPQRVRAHARARA